MRNYKTLCFVSSLCFYFVTQAMEQDGAKKENKQCIIPLSSYGSIHFTRKLVKHSPRTES